MTRIHGGGLSRNPFGHVEAARAHTTESLQQQVEQELFGGKRPKPIERDSQAAQEQLALLSAWVKKLARFAGDEFVVVCRDLRRADEVFLSSTLRDIGPVTHVDGKPVGNGEAGQRTARLMGAFQEFVQTRLRTHDAPRWRQLVGDR